MKKGKKGVLGGRVDARNGMETAAVTVIGKSAKGSHLAEYQFKPGESANPNGRPRTSDLKAELRAFADESDPKVRKTRLRVWLEMADRRARQGSPKHLELLLAYGWGRPNQALEVETTFNYTDSLTKMKEARRRLEEHRVALPAATPANGHSAPQEAQAAALLPDQAVSQAREDDAERPAPAPPRITVEL